MRGLEEFPDDFEQRNQIGIEIIQEHFVISHAFVIEMCQIHNAIQNV
jgi:hypothetical protein